MVYVYLLRLANGNIYKGLTEDLNQRLKQHSRGKVASTSNQRPFSVIGYEAYLEKSDAIRREKFLKTSEGKRLLKQQYKDILAVHSQVLGGVA